MQEAKVNPLSLVSSSSSILGFFSHKEEGPKEMNGSTNGQACINLLKSFIGLGLMTQPFIFAQTGFALSAFILVLMGFLTFYTSNLAFKVSDETDESFVNSLGRTKNIYQIFVFILQCGICVVYVLFFLQFFESLFKGHDIIGSRYFAALVSCAMVLPVIFVENIKNLSKPSFLASFLILGTVIIIASYDLNKISNHGIKHNLHPFNFSNLFSTIGIFVLAFEAIGSTTIVRESMNHPQKFDNLFKGVLSLVVSLLTIFAILNCLTFGANVNPILILGLAEENSSFVVLQGFYVLAILLSFPIQFYSGVYYLEASQIMKDKSASIPFFKQKLRAFIILLIFLIAVIIPKFSSFINLIGSIFAGSIQFIFPIISYHRTFGSEISSSKYFFNLGIIAFAIIASCFGSFHSIIELIKS